MNKLKAIRPADKLFDSFLEHIKNTKTPDRKPAQNMEVYSMTYNKAEDGLRTPRAYESWKDYEESNS